MNTSPVLTLVVASAFLVLSVEAKDGKEKPTAPGSGQKGNQGGQKDDGQQGQKDDGQQGQKDDGQQNHKSDGQQNHKNDGQQGQKEVAVTVENKPAIQMTVPKDATITTKGDKTTIETKDLKLRMYLWRVPGAQTVDAVIPLVGTVIKSEFLEFKLESTTTLQVAGHEARHLKGKGEEADDNDPGGAEVVVFTDGTNFFAACVHGEKDHAEKQRPEFLKVLESVKVL